ncbi:MAG: calcium-binding protein [Hyphomicrobiales bacterium]
MLLRLTAGRARTASRAATATTCFWSAARKRRPTASTAARVPIPSGNDSAADVAFSKFKPKGVEVFDNTGTDLLDHAILGTTGNDSLNFKGLTLLGVTRIDGLAGNDTLTGNDEANVILGGDGKDTLDGAAGDDTLDGGAGKDSMTGGDGDDTFIVDDVGDKISEKKNGGTDTVEIIGFTAGKAFTLANNVEKLTIDDGVAISASGNGLDNLIVAGDGANTLNGAGGDDTLSGGNGNDVFVIRKVDGRRCHHRLCRRRGPLDVQKLGYNLAQMLGALIQTPGGALFDFGNNGSEVAPGC